MKRAVLWFSRFLIVLFILYESYYAIRDVFFWGHLPAAHTATGLIIGCVLLIFSFTKPVRRLAGRLPEFPVKGEETVTEEIPKEWLKETMREGGRDSNPFETPAGSKPAADTVAAVEVDGAGETIAVTIEKPRKYHFRALKWINRGVAVIVLIYNFFMSQAVLMSRPDTYVLFIPFFLSAYISLRYLWVSRRKKGTAKWGETKK